MTDAHYIGPRFEDLVFLLEAFDITGRHLYGAEWDGHEFEAGKVPSYRTDARSRLGEARKELANLNDDRKLLLEKQNKTIEEAESARIKSALTETDQRSKQLVQEIAGLKPSQGGLESDLKRRDRRDITLEKLTSALKSGDLRALHPAFSYINEYAWQDPGEFSIILPLSYVVRRRRKSSFRRETVLLERVPHHDWLSRIVPINPEGLEKLSDEVRARHIAKEIVADASRAMSQEQFEGALRARVPGLSRRAAIRIWSAKGSDSVIPSTWKRRGPKPR